MDDYRAQFEKEFEFYGTLEGFYFKDKIDLFNKVRYTIFLLNGTGCTLIATIKREQLDSIFVDPNSSWGMAFLIFLLGVAVSVGAILAAYLQLVHLTVYAHKLRGFKEIQLRLIAKFEDYVRGNNYSKDFSPFSQESGFFENQALLQRMLAEHEALREANYYNYEIGDRYETISLGCCSVACMIFGCGVSVVFSLNSGTPDGTDALARWIACSGHLFNVASMVGLLLFLAYQMKKIFDLVEKRAEKYDEVKKSYEDISADV